MIRDDWRTLLLLSVAGMCLARGALFGSDGSLLLQPRYYNFMVPQDRQSKEGNTGYSRLQWKIPLSQAALVLVDVWDRHYLKDTEQRINDIVQTRIAPLVKQFRRAGIQVIHAPGPRLARESPLHVSLETSAKSCDTVGDPVYPPADFRNKTGAFKSFARPAGRRSDNATPAIHPAVKPDGNDLVVATGDELHALCTRKGILFLFYVGFHPNGCLITRDYGMPRMRFVYKYEVILVRDCTTAMESVETNPTLALTRHFTSFFEMFVGYSCTSDQLLAVLPRSSR